MNLIPCIDASGAYGELSVLPDGATQVPKRPSVFHQFVDGKWQANVKKAQADQLEAIRAACANAIVSGFKSSALGKPYTYGSTATDQNNLSANVLSSIYPGLPADWTTLQLCADSSGQWDYRPHSAAQIQQAGSDAKAAILACLTRKAQLQAQIAAATSLDAVQAVVW